ncbi:MAG: tRNA (adenosine(37)-N6)-threonylcarbamoyltransferase complex ATPase subunit type 1 TsaE [Candidatus Caldatribacteriota bacterium]|nr:tRNA (adenosine(37)-N6)-threonylcarbamoyltransferase complex ATPase subunit type 1 TsaE [Candidatus Caldatribacteriota bacterium]
MNLNIITKSPEETKKIGEKIAKLIKSGDILLFFGELGAGKTCFIQGIAEELKVKDYVTSPSFTIINEYQGKIPIYHFDLFRLNNFEEIVDLGYEEYFYGNGLTLVEWAEKLEKNLPVEYLKIIITFLDFQRRKLTFTSKGDRFVKLFKELKKNENIRD